MSMSMPDMSMSMPNKECVKDGDTFTISMYKEGSDEQYDIEDLALKWCCSGTLNGKACTSSIEMDENGISLPEGSCEGKCGVPDDDVAIDTKSAAVSAGSAVSVLAIAGAMMLI